MLLLCRHRGYHVLLFFVNTITLTCFVIVYTLTSDSFPRGGCAAKARRPSLRPSCGKCCTGVRVCTRGGGGCCAPQPSQSRGTEQTSEKLTTFYSESGNTDLRHGNSCTGVCKGETRTRTETRTRGPATATLQSSTFKMRTMGS